MASQIQEGARLPDVALKTATADGGIGDITTKELCEGKKVVLFAVPGAFTPTCSAQHLPGFVARAAELKAKGVDAIACLSVNDAFVMGAWAADRGVGDTVMMLADGNGDFTRAVGLDLDASGAAMGLRSQRYAMIVDDGVVTKLAVDAPMKFEVSSAEAVLAAL